jgi:hypothetical protein
VQNDVQEVLETISETVNDDAEIRKLCINERKLRNTAAAAAARGGIAKLPPELNSSGGHTPAMRMASAILESVEFQLQGTFVSVCAGWVGDWGFAGRLGLRVC